MRKELLTSVCALSLLFGAGTAFAGTYGEPVEAEESPAAPPAPRAIIEEEIDYARVGPYIGIGGLYAIERFNNRSNVVSGNSDTDNSNGYHVLAGYRVHPNVAVELRFNHYLNFETDPFPGHFEGWSLMTNVKGYLLTGRYQPYLVVGLGYLDINYPGANRPQDPTPGDDFAMRFGAGLDANITEHVAIGPEIAYGLPFGEVDEFDMIEISLGLRYKF